VCVELSKRWINTPLRGQYPALLPVRSGEPLLFSAPLPMGEGLVPEPAPGLDHHEHSLLLLSVRYRRKRNADFFIPRRITHHPIKGPYSEFIP